MKNIYRYFCSLSTHIWPAEHICGFNNLHWHSFRLWIKYSLIGSKSLCLYLSVFIRRKHLHLSQLLCHSWIVIRTATSFTHPVRMFSQLIWRYSSTTECSNLKSSSASLVLSKLLPKWDLRWLMDQQWKLRMWTQPGHQNESGTIPKSHSLLSA